MKRHHLFILLLSMVIGLATARPLHEGSDYKKLSKLFPSVHPNKIEVVEIFAYNCFHCQHFEPLVEDFAKKLESEIINNKTYYSFNKVLKVALSKAEPTNFKEVIYA